MARDRQRAKQRRRRQDGAQRQRARREERLDGLVEDPDVEGTTPGSHRDAGLEDVVDPLADDGTTPAPDPLKHGSPWIDEAKLAEAGAEVPEPSGEGLDVRDSAPGLDGDFGGSPGEGEIYDDERSPDEVQGDRAPRRRRVAAANAGAIAAGGPAERHEPSSRARPIAFLGHCVDELKRVQWPDRRHTFQGTAVTLGFVVIAGAYLGLMDAIWKPIIEAIL